MRTTCRNHTDVKTAMRLLAAIDEAAAGLDGAEGSFIETALTTDGSPSYRELGCECPGGRLGIALRPSNATDMNVARIAVTPTTIEYTSPYGCPRKRTSWRSFDDDGAPLADAEIAEIAGLAARECAMLSMMCAAGVLLSSDADVADFEGKLASGRADEYGKRDDLSTVPRTGGFWTSLGA